VLTNLKFSFGGMDYMGSFFFFALSQPGRQSSYLELHMVGVTNVYQPHPACWLEWGLANFFPGLILNLDPLDLYLLNTWDCRSEPPLDIEEPFET
jgi:hypothetical protein